jgi:hypothetical protein
MSRDNLDMMAVQRDAALLDALSQRVRPDGPDHNADPVVGLLAALVIDVDDGLGLDVAARPAAPSFIPEQSRRRVAQDAPAATLQTSTVFVAPVRRRHAVRAVAAMVVTAAVLSVSGVAAAVSGDPLKPYKDVINVVRGGYHDVMPNRSLIAPQSIAVVPKAKGRAAKAAREAHQPVTTRASRSAESAAGAPIVGGRHTIVREVADRHESPRASSGESSGDNVSGGHESGDDSGDPGQWGGSDDQSPEHDSTEHGDDSTPEHESGGYGEHEDG